MIKNSVQARLNAMKDGDRVVVDRLFKRSKDGNDIRRPEVVATFRSPKTYSEIRSHEKWPKGEDGPRLVTSEGEVFYLHTDTSGNYRPSRFLDADGNERSVLWTRPLPRVSDDKAINFVKKMRGESVLHSYRHVYSYEPSPVVIVDRIEGDFAMCKMVSWSDETVGIHEKCVEEAADGGLMSDDTFHFVNLETFPEKVERHGDFTLSAYDLKIPMNSLPKDTEEQSLVAGDTLVCEFQSTELITKVYRPHVVGSLKDAPLSDWFPFIRSAEDKVQIAADLGRVPLQTIQFHLKEVERAKAALLPNEALVLVIPADEDMNSDYSCILELGTRGATFFDDTGTLNDDLESIIPEEGGLWVLEGAKYWSSRDDWTGECDGGLDGDFRPATEEDLKLFGMSREQVNIEADANYEEGNDFLEAIKDGTFADKMMEIAREAEIAWQSHRNSSTGMSL